MDFSYKTRVVEPQEIKSILRDASKLGGLEELSQEQEEEMRANFHNLTTCLEVIEEEFPSFEKLESSRQIYKGIYKVLKLISISAINLMDMESPSLMPLKPEGNIDIKQGDNELRVF